MRGLRNLKKVSSSESKGGVQIQPHQGILIASWALHFFTNLFNDTMTDKATLRIIELLTSQLKSYNVNLVSFLIRR